MSTFVLSETDYLLNCFCLVSIVIIGYDILLTFSREVDCIWRRKFSAITMFYFALRYCKIGVDILDFVSPTFSHGCKAIQITQNALSVLSSFGISLFQSLRVWAICGTFNIRVCMVLVTSMFAPLVNIYNFSRPTSYIVMEGVCTVIAPAPPGSPGFFPILTRSVAVLSDVLVLVTTWMKTADVIRVKNFRPKLSTLIVRDGTLYFCALLALNSVTILLDVLARYQVNGATSFILVNEGVAVTLISRFILDLRSVFYTNNPADQMTSIRFTGTFAGNLAAPLAIESTWMTGPADDAEDEQSREMHSEDPFSVGFVDGDSTTLHDSSA